MSWIRLPLFFMISIPLSILGDERKNCSSNISLYIYICQLSCILSLDACIASFSCNKCGPIYQGTFFVVPCGNHKEDTTTLLTYYNENETLSNNIMFLRMNTTYKDNNTKIYCKVYDEEGSSSCYQLNIQCKLSSYKSKVQDVC